MRSPFISLLSLWMAARLATIVHRNQNFSF
jgi:hypothetical protein